MLFLALAAAALVGVAATWAGRTVAPDMPVWVGALAGLFALVVLLAWIARVFRWIMPWYYLLPAMLFLATFTLMPIGLTVFLAFTDYAGSRNNQLNPTTATPITAVDGAVVEVESAASLRCQVLHDGCTGVRARLYASGTTTVRGATIEGSTLTLEAPLDASAEVTAVELELPDFGIRAQFPVVSVDGAVVELGRAPPGAVNLEEIELALLGTTLERSIVAVEGDRVTLDDGLPEGVAFARIARYNDFSLVGLANFRTILSRASRSLVPVFSWNLAFATLTVLVNIAFGVFLAVLLNNPDLHLRNLYRTLLIVPWALPAVITIQVWKGLLNYNFGAINRLLALFGVPAVDWLGDPVAAKAAVLLVNLWLSFPFMMVATLGALSAIPRELYEASRIDGATPWQGFWSITAPLLRSALVPIALTSFALSFNNFNVIFLLTDGGPATAGGTSTARATDILISWAYNEAFRSQGGFAYGMGSAISILIFGITLAVSLLNFRVTGALKEEANV